jgi:hypothetical protein
MAIRVRQELGYAPGNGDHAKTPSRDLLEFINEDGDVIFFIETTKTWVQETVQGYLGTDPDIEGKTLEFEVTTVSYGVPAATTAPKWRQID